MGCPRASDEMTPKQRPEWIRVRREQPLGEWTQAGGWRGAAGGRQGDWVTVHWGREGWGEMESAQAQMTSEQSPEYDYGRDRLHVGWQQAFSRGVCVRVTM